MTHRTRPALEQLESRDLLALIIDIDTGIQGNPGPNVSMFPHDFTVPGSTTVNVTSGHGTWMAERFVAAEAALGRNDQLIDEKVSGADNLFFPSDIAATLEWDAKYFIPAYLQQHPGTAISIAMPLAGPGPAALDMTTALAEMALGREGVTLCAAAGDAGTDNDVTPYWPAADGTLGAVNVMSIAATVPASPSGNGTEPLATADPNAALQSWSNYGISVAVAVPAWEGTSEAAILGAIALASQAEAYPCPAGVTPGEYALATVHAVISSATIDHSPVAQGRE